MMSWFRRLAMLARRQRFERDLEDEMRLHLDLRAAESPGGAAAARRRFGNETLVRESSREAWGWRWLDDLAKDLRYGLRTLQRSPGFTAVAVLALALGIGANTAILSVVNGVLLRPLPYADPDRLVTILKNGQSPDVPANLFEWREATRSYDAMGAAESWSPNLAGVDRPEAVRSMRTTPEVLALLGVRPVLGRTFAAEEGEPGHEHVVVLGWEAWQRRFAGAADVLGRTVMLDGQSYSVVGVMPRGFRFAPFWNTQAEMWAPLVLGPKVADRSTGSLRIFARLAPGATLAQARAELSAVTERLERLYPGSNRDVQIVPLADKVIGNVRPALLVLLAAVGFVLLVACANVAHMLLARAQARRREVVLRTALGAGRLRIVRQFLAESLLLAAIGGGLGLVLGVFGTDLLVALDPVDVPRVASVSVDGTVLGVMVAIILVAGVGFGLVPALRATSADLGSALKDGGRTGTEGGRHGRLRSLLVVSQFALALPLLVGAGLMIRSFAALQSVNPGFDADGVLSMTVSVSGTGQMTEGRRSVFFPELVRRVSALPGVTAASAINHLPLAGDVWGTSLAFADKPLPRAGAAKVAVYRTVLPGYFATMRIPLLAGRDVDAHDGADGQKVVIVNQRLAAETWPGEDPLGKRLAFYDGQGDGPDWMTVVGTVKDTVQQSFTGAPDPEVYVPLLQVERYLTSPIGAFAYVTLVVRSGGDAAALTSVIRAAVRDLEPGAAVSSVATLATVVLEATSRPRFYLVLLGAFAAMALVLAATGIYGVMSYAVSRRTQEIGVRMALGAQRGDVLRLVVGQGVGLALGGAAVGLVVSLALAHFMSGLLYGVAPTDPLTLASVSVVLAVVATVACLVPAQRATRIDPMVALRSD